MSFVLESLLLFVERRPDIINHDWRLINKNISLKGADGPEGGIVTI